MRHLLTFFAAQMLLLAPALVRPVAAQEVSEGALIRGTAQQVYLVVFSQKRAVSPSLFPGCGLNAANVQTIDNELVNDIPTGTVLATAADCTSAKNKAASGPADDCEKVRFYEQASKRYFSEYTKTDATRWYHLKQPLKQLIIDAEAKAHSARQACSFRSIGPFFDENSRTNPYSGYRLDGQSGKIDVLVKDPTNSKVMYAAGGIRGWTSNSGIFRTDDGGLTWAERMTGLAACYDASGAACDCGTTTCSNRWKVGTIRALGFGPDNRELFAATRDDGIFRSLDGGENWARVNDSLKADAFAVFGGRLYVATAKGVFTWSPGTLPGKLGTFNLSGGKDTRLSSLTIGKDGTGKDTLFAGGDSIIRLKPGETAWTTLGKPSSGNIDVLAAHPAKSTLYALADGGVFVSNDGGSTWNPVKDLRFIQWLAIGAADLGSGTNNRPVNAYFASNGGIRCAPADGSTSPQLASCGTQYVDVRQLIVERNENGTDDRCIALTDQGVNIVEDCRVPRNGAADVRGTFKGRKLSTSLVPGLSVSPDGKTILAQLMDFSGPVTTTDGGKSWINNDTLFLGEGEYSGVNPFDATTCFAVGLHFLRSTDGCKKFGETWVSAAGSNTRLPLLSGNGVSSSKFAFVNKSTFYFVSDPIYERADSAGLWKTVDAGGSFSRERWENAPDFNTNFYDTRFTRLIAVSPIDSKHILTAGCPKAEVDATSMGPGGKLSGGSCSLLVVSFDGGRTWTKSSGLPAPMSMGSIWLADPLSVAISSKPDAAGRYPTVLAAWRDSAGKVGVYRSADGGKTFTTATLSLPKRRSGYDAGTVPGYGGIAYAPSSQGQIAAIATNYGLYFSKDDGKTWGLGFPQDAGAWWKGGDFSTMMTGIFTGVRFDDAGCLYASTWGQGVVKSPMPIGKWLGTATQQATAACQPTP